MSSILNRQKQLAEQARRQREEQRVRPVAPMVTAPLPPKFPKGSVEAVSPDGIAMGRRHTVKIGSRRIRRRGKKTMKRTRKN